LLFKPFGY
jgi:hypothetical protein